MDIKKLAPWNWFKKEEEENAKTVPVKQQRDQNRNYALQSPIHQIHQEVDRLFDNVFRSFGISPLGSDRLLIPQTPEGILRPTLNVSSTDSEYTINVEIPGVDEKDVRLELDNDTLVIRGEKKQEKEEKDKHYYRMECSYGSFQRLLSLPEDADQDNIGATFKKGILTIRVPRKALPKSDVRRIEVKSV